MEILVTKNKLSVIDNDILNENEYNVTDIDFTFSEEYSDNLVKIALFSSQNATYKKIISENKCKIPAEILAQKGIFVFGVYAYSVENEELILRYSPSPLKLAIDIGSYIPDEQTENSEPITPSELEQYQQALNDGLREAENVDISATKVDDVATITITDRTGTQTSVEIYDGDDYIITEEDYKAIAKIVESEGLPVATSDRLGGVLASSKGSNDTVEVSVDSNGKLFVPKYPSKTSDLNNDSGFIDNTVNDLTNYTKTSDMNTAISNAIETETTNRRNADVRLQNQIDAITSASDVVDVVGTYADLQNYDITKLTADDVIKVLQDNTHNNALAYYRWVMTNNVGVWDYIGSEGPFYTKSETDTLLNSKQDIIDSSHKLNSDLVDDTNQTNKFVTSEEKTAWNNKVNPGTLQDYTKRNDYATSIFGGTVKSGFNGFSVNENNGKVSADEYNYSSYGNAGNNIFISKGTLENVITGKNLETTDNKVTSISSSSTDTQYPSAKCVYDSQIAQDTEINSLKEENTFLKSQIPTDIVEGTNFTINDSTNLPIEEVEVEGRTEQAQYEGYNILNESNFSGVSNVDSISNKVITSTSLTKTGYENVIVSFDSINIEAGDIYMSCDVRIKSGSCDKFNSLQITNNNGPVATSAAWIQQPTLGSTYKRFNRKLTLSNAATGTKALFQVLNPNNLVVEITNVQLSTTNSSYEPYVGGEPSPSPDYPQTIHTVTGNCSVEISNSDNSQTQTYPLSLGSLELCKIGNVADYIYKSGENWFLHEEIGLKTYTELDNFDLSSTSTDDFYIFQVKPASKLNINTSVNQVYSETFKFDGVGMSNKGYENIMLNNDTEYIRFTISASRLSEKSVTAFRTWLETNNVNIYYPLATVTNTQITDTTLIGQLNALSQATTYDKITVISSTGADLEPTVRLTYKEDLPTVINNLRSRLALLE